MLRLRLSRVSWLIVISLVASYWWMATSTMPRLGLTFDEAGHVASGYAHWKFRDYRLNAEDGVLATRVSAWPLLGMDLVFPSRDGEDWAAANAHAIGYDLMFALGNPFENMLWRARAATALFGVLLLGLIFVWARRLFGPAGGWLALVVAAFSPTLLAQGGLATADIVLTGCLFAALTAWWHLLHRVSWVGLLLAGLLSGATLLAKMSGVILTPIVVVLVVARVAGGRPWCVSFGKTSMRLRARRDLAVAAVSVTGGVAVVSIALLWCGYGFRFAADEPRRGVAHAFELSWAEVLGEAPRSSASLEGQTSRLFVDEHLSLQPTVISRAISWTRSHHLLPEAYLWGFANTYRNVRQRPSFLFGRVSQTGWATFFPVAFLIKSTPTEILLALAGVGALAVGLVMSGTKGRGRRGAGWWVYRLAPLLTLFVVYWLAALTSRLNIGQRHLLPVYPVVFVFCGATAIWLTTRWRRSALGVMILLMTWQVVESVRARPFYLSYFTPIVGGMKEGWHYLVDSSFDWGQGLPDLKTWMDEKEGRGDHAPVFLTYFGWDSPKFRGIDATRFGDARFDSGARSFPALVRGGWFAISATHFQRIYLNLSGPWGASYETLYQEIWHSLPRDAETVRRMSTAEHARFMLDACDLETLQFGRLCYFLQNRGPDAIVGSSLLMFKLSDDDLRFALLASLDDVTARVQLERRH